MNISDYLRNALLNEALGVAAYIQPTTVYAGLYTTPPPTSAGGGVEISAADYTRVATSWSTASAGTIQNSAQIRFPVTGATQSNWGSAVALGLFDAIVDGHLLYYGPVSAGVILSINSDFAISPAALTITLT